MRIVSFHGADQMLHQDVVDLLRLHAFEGQVKSACTTFDRVLVDRRLALGKEDTSGTVGRPC